MTQAPRYEDIPPRQPATHLTLVKNLGDTMVNTLTNPEMADRAPRPDIVEKFDQHCRAHDIYLPLLDPEQKAKLPELAHDFLYDYADAFINFRFPTPELRRTQPMAVLPKKTVSSRLELLHEKQASSVDTVQREQFDNTQAAFMEIADSGKNRFLEIKGLNMLIADLQESDMNDALEALYDLKASYGIVLSELHK